MCDFLVEEQAEIAVDCMHRIKAVSAQILDQKLKEAEGLDSGDTSTKKDIMSLLVRARKAEEEAREKEKGKFGMGATAGPEPYKMSDKEMMDQVVSDLLSAACINEQELTVFFFS
jgi:hypothetical protein